MKLGSQIMYYRKNKNITQEALAKQLNISNQAVSKWETEQSYPDIELLPKIADIFGITLDELFGRKCEEKNDMLCWQEDTIYAVLFKGNHIVHREKLDGNAKKICKNITFEYIGKVHNIQSDFNVCCQDVSNNVNAGGYVECGNVGNNVEAGDYVECGNVGNNVNAGAQVECGNVEGNVKAGAQVECGNVGGTVKEKVL